MKRREFTKMAGMGALAVSSFPSIASSMVSPYEGGRSTAVPLGICNHALRGMRPNATQLIEFAIEHKLDCVQYNTLTVFESLEEAYLAKLKELAHANDIRIYTGVGSICESSLSFSDRYGDADTLLKKGIRVASALGSPIVGVRIGNLEDRYTEGALNPKSWKW